MKIFKYEPTDFIRISIARQGDVTEYLSLVETTIPEVEVFLKELISSKNLSPFAKGKRTSINLREALGGMNGKSKSISFRGLSPKETTDLIVKKLTKQIVKNSATKR